LVGIGGEVGMGGGLVPILMGLLFPRKISNRFSVGERGQGCGGEQEGPACESGKGAVASRKGVKPFQAP